MYLVCWNHDCRQTYPADNYKAEDRDVKCEKCGGTLISPSGRVQLSFNPYVIQTLDPNKIVECEECCGSGFSGPGTGYDSVCDRCGGDGAHPA
jgi:ribosomal protein S27E